MMLRNLDTLAETFLDVLIVGGGIHGAALVRHAARAGYVTGLLEKDDFCAATSANSLKILHGGLRYLQHLNFRRMRHSITARREMMRIAPHLVKPLACLMPLSGKGVRSRPVMRTALLLNDCIGWDRNLGLPEDIRLPGGRVLSRQECLAAVPGLAGKKTVGASVWYDALAVNSERLALEYILDGVEHGAQVANYAEVTEIARQEKAFVPVTARDRLTGKEYRIRARYVINAAGPWFETLLRPGDDKEHGCKWALALNIISKKQIFSKYAVALEGQRSYEDRDAVVKRGKRLYFFVPWRGRTMIGTEYEESGQNPDNLRVRAETICNMVEEINAIYPPARLDFSDITFYHAGLLPMSGKTESGAVQLQKNSIFSADRDWSRVLSVKGVKYTTAPHVAREVVRYLKRHLPPRGKGSRLVTPAVAGKTGPASAQREKIAAGKNRCPDEINRPAKADVLYFIAEEMACTLSDIVFRRTGLGTAECPDRRLLEELADWMGAVLEWDETRQRQEIETVFQRYAPLQTGEPSP
jgi:glycerol-3-phosphate dehydrogenase